MMTIRVDDLTSPATRALIVEHVAEMRGTSPAESCHVIGVDELARPGTTVWTAWRDEELLGIAALQTLDAERGELKSMRTTARARGTGVGRALLRHVVDAATARGMRSLWLETGADEHFRAARTLYTSEGFTVCPAFGAYVDDPLSVFFTRSLP